MRNGKKTLLSWMIFMPHHQSKVDQIHIKTLLKIYLYFCCHITENSDGFFYSLGRVYFGWSVFKHRIRYRPAIHFRGHRSTSRKTCHGPPEQLKPRFNKRHVFMLLESNLLSFSFMLKLFMPCLRSFFLTWNHDMFFYIIL